MKTVNETFLDAEHEALLNMKGKKTWRKFILELAGLKEEKNGKKQ